jgi:hypothetical protein
MQSFDILMLYMFMFRPSEDSAQEINTIDPSYASGLQC